MAQNKLGQFNDPRPEMSIQLLVKHIKRCKKIFLSIFINENNEQILPFLWHQCPKVNLLPNPDQGDMSPQILAHFVFTQFVDVIDSFCS